MEIYTADEAKKAANHHIVKNLEKCLDNIFKQIKMDAQEGRSKLKITSLLLDGHWINWSDINDASRMLIMTELKKSEYEVWDSIGDKHCQVCW